VAAAVCCEGFRLMESGRGTAGSWHGLMARGARKGEGKVWDLQLVGGWCAGEGTVCVCKKAGIQPPS
jgi:hypothetical protein